MKIALGVTGGIAAYKAAELLRLLQDRGLDIEVVMTRSARRFITPLTFASLSGHPVITDLFSNSSGRANSAESSIEHIRLAQSVDALVVAPATADILARMAQGIADDFLTTLYLAITAPVIVAPSMNVNMWRHAATGANLSVLKQRGVRVVEPEAGYLACGMTGEGRLAAPEAIAAAAFETLGLRDDLKNEAIIVTAGPTQEAIDPVRVLSNRSSGKMGYALAEAARRRGARVHLISGPSRITPPAGVAIEDVTTAEEMADAVLNQLNQATVLLMAAAVADYQAETIAKGKIKKTNGSISLRLAPTRDILSEVRERRRPGQLVVGFAAETDNVLKHAAEKLAAKGLDLIVANDVTREGAGFDSDTNIVTLVFPGGRTDELEKASKIDVAHRILDSVVKLRNGGR